MYHPGAMRRAAGAIFIAILVAALPTVVSLCELRCSVSRLAASKTLPSCAGHAAGKQGKAPTSVPSREHDDCAEHVLLAKGNGTGIEVQIDRAIVAILRPLDSLVVTPDQQLERGKLAAAGLSPPFGRSTDILRL